MKKNGGSFALAKLQAVRLCRIAAIALVMIIGFAFIACPGDPGGNGDGDGDGNGNGNGDNTTTIGSGRFAGKDVLGNSYSLSVGSDASRAAVKGDRFEMNVTPRDGKHRRVTGKVKDINEDGTLTLETDTGEEFNAVVDSSTLDSVAGVGDEMPQIPFTGDPIGGSQTLTPRTFDTINLRATRWVNTNGYERGENWGSNKSVLLRDFPTNVSTLQPNSGNRYTITISGTSDVDLDFINIEVQGLNEDDEWKYLTGVTTNATATAGTPFTITGNVNGVSTAVNLLNYKEIILQVTNVMKYDNDNEPAWTVNNGTIPADIPDGTILSTISDFKISLKDTSREAFKGNMNDFHYGIQSDGMSLDYRRAEWSLTAQNIIDAKKPGARFEFVMTGLNGDDDVNNDYLSDENITIGFAWQDPVRELWWQDEYQIIGKRPDDNYATYQIADGVEWIPWQKKIRIDISEAVGSQFAASTQLNFEVGYWWRGGEDGATECIDELGISGANIVPPPPSCAGNIGNWYYGYEANGITFHLKQAVWHLPATVLTTAKTSGAKLEIEFTQDISNLGENIGQATLALIWQGIDTQRWWPTDAEAGTDDKNLIIYCWDSTANASLNKTGVTYDSTAKKLTVVLENALETYNSFKTANDVNLILDCYWGASAKIDELGIVSANIE